MSMHPAIPEEAVVQSYADFTLTTHRLVYASRDGASDEVLVSIPLEHVQWTMMARSQKKWLLVMTALLVAGSGVCAYRDLTYGAIALGITALACFVAFWLTRRAVLSVGAGSVTCESCLGLGDSDGELALVFLRRVDGHVLRAKGAKPMAVAAPTRMAA